MRTVARAALVFASGAVLAVGLGATGGSAFAASKTGQPNVECEDFAMRPGKSASAPGSPFNENGHAGTVYAGEQRQNSKNPKSVSQYDVACRQVSQ
ncbi:hypothetical protein GA0070624_1889 [Micromonospora rhizosphaerae]|uniref:Adenylate cyclase n=1 Tax=Micromonospora rhizosphaerae TaxID=568872 RepID=A0A1C6RSG9_9ACTN|nr:adenylate cyclase [Micromonospora rhizosphaerae]SCL19982.1 hypothetical protein GA0070624_1889 [Micromonospora rhizosphaerae]